jgi:hypothetical protein
VTLDVAYVRQSIDAALRLAFRDRTAWNGFDLTPEGFYRSFFAIILVMPFNILLDLFAQQLEATREGGNPGTYGLPEAMFSTLALCAEWLIFPLMALFLLRFLGYAHRYSALVIAHNWGTVVVQFIKLPIVVLFSWGLISPALALDFYFIAVGLTLYYRYYIAQTALDSPASVAIAIVILSFLLQTFFLMGLSATQGLWLRTP